MDFIVKESIQEQSYKIIKKRILSHQYNFGQTISVTDLSKELSISNTPIREAMLILQSEGFVCSNKSAQFQVIEYSDKLFQDVNGVMPIIMCGSYVFCELEGRLDILRFYALCAQSVGF